MLKSCATILAVLALPQLFSMSQYASGIILLGMSRHKILAQVAAVEGVLNLVLSIVLVKHMGLMGVAVGTVVPHAISVVVVIPLYTLRATGLSVREYIAQAYARPLLSAIPTGALCYVLSTVIHGPSAAVFAGEVLAVCSAYRSEERRVGKESRSRWSPYH